MRTILMIIAAFSALIGSADAEMSKDQCTSMVDGTKAIADQLKRMDVAFIRLQMKKNAELTSGEIYESAGRVEKARQQVLESLRTYQAAADSLSKQLHDCAGLAVPTTRNVMPMGSSGMAPLFPQRSAPGSR